MDRDVRARKIYRVTFVGMVVNILLCAFKFVAGILGRSGAMVADAVHSASDLATDLVVLLFVRVSSKPKDRNHKWGHGKYETFATLIIGVALGLVGVQILITSGEAIAAVVRGEELPRPGLLALVAAAVSIIVKEILFRYTISVGRSVDSPSVIANSWHHRSDALSSIGTFLGIGAAYFLGAKWRIADPIAAIVVAALIIKVAIDLSRSSISELLERSLPERVEEEIISTISEVEGVCCPHNLRTRKVGPSIVIDVHIRVDGSMSVHRSHDITREIERMLKERYGEDTIVAIHVEPLK